MEKVIFKLSYRKNVWHQGQKPCNTIGELKKAVLSEVGKAKGGSKIGTTSAEKKDRNVNKSPYPELMCRMISKLRF